VGGGELEFEVRWGAQRDTALDLQVNEALFRANRSAGSTESPKCRRCFILAAQYGQRLESVTAGRKSNEGWDAQHRNV
jgi:hypothetical protein